MAPANPSPPPASASPQPGGQAGGPTAASQKDFGEIAVERGYCTAQQIAEAREEQRRQGLPPETLGALLVQKGVLSQEEARACARATRGAAVIGGFEILDKVGQGGMGVVFRAKQISMDRIVALKILPPRLAQDPTFKKRFLHEAQLSARLSHINIINGIDCGEDRGYVFFAMEFVDGKTLKEILKEKGRLAPAEAFAVVRQVAEALVYAQDHGLVHRDVKPDNIMLTGNNVAKLCDLGLAKKTNDDAALTRDGHAVGTPHYISPEQARGEKTVDTRSDIYSLGATFYHLLTGKPPFEAPTGASVMALHITDEARNPCDLDPLLPTGYGQLISKMMAKSAADRYASARELVEDLDAAKQKKVPKAAAFRAKSSCAWPRRLLRQQTGVQTPAGEKRATGPQKPTASRTPLVAAAVCTLALVAGGAYWLSVRNRGAEETKMAQGQPGEQNDPATQTPPQKTGGADQAPATAPSKVAKPPETGPKVP
ncbi:MAG: serine/threonine-protein kinase, partial [Planctomycetota bacterium]|nr:serine/threonine-protein kinase [Planctomycetota bacterium]